MLVNFAATASMKSNSLGSDGIDENTLMDGQSNR